MPLDDSARSADLSTLVGLVGRQWSRIAIAALAMGIAAAATAGYAFLVGPVVQSLFGEGGEIPAAPGEGPGSRFLDDLGARISTLDPWIVGLLIVVVAAVKGAAFFAHRSLVASAGQRVLLDLRGRLYRAVLSMGPLSRGARARGDLTSRFSMDVETVHSAVSDGLLAIARDGLQVAALGVLIFSLDPVLALVGLAAFPPTAWAIARIGREMRRRQGAVLDAFGGMGEVVDETAAGLAVIRAFEAEEIVAARFRERIRRLARAMIRAAVLRAMASPANEILGAAALALTLWYAQDRIGAGLLSPGEFLSFFTALFLLYRPVRGLGQAHHSIRTGLAGLDRLVHIMEGKEPGPERGEGAGADAPPTGVRRVVIRGVEAGYEDGPSVLDGFDLEIPAGLRTAVVGPSGAGKTTLVNVLSGFLIPRAGDISVEAEDGSEIRANARRVFAPVFQEPFLFDDTIRANVRCGRLDARDEEIEAACEAAGVLEFAERLDGGLDHRAGIGGAGLSVGQRQRVCLARALVSRAPVLLFDEVTAPLDGETEQNLVDSLGEHLAGRTAVIVTHRLATARWSDRVSLIEKGRVVAQGPAGSMLASHPRVARLFGSQMEEESEDGGA